LPLVSYGGSNLLATFAILGMAEGIVVASHSTVKEDI
jgi:cell division protein FtsW (lipid II flippase)